MTQDPQGTIFSQEHRELAEVFGSVWLMGPPMSSELEQLIAHLFSREEAAVARHLPYYIPKPAKKIARRAGKPLAEVAPILDAMADRRIILRIRKFGYALLPLIPGMFEHLLMDGVDTPWRRTYAELINRLYATGFMRRYSTTPVPALRFIPVEQAVEHQSCIVDADLMSKMIALHKHMAVLNVCQCRQAGAFTGKHCLRSSPEDGCLVFGSFAVSVAEEGTGRLVSGSEMQDIVKQRWEKNLIFWAVNLEPSEPNFICTCCDCCCHLVESINHFGGRACMAEPHFLADMDGGDCKGCGRCAKACNTNAHTMAGKEHGFDREKCIGCGLCVDACPQKIISMKENPRYKAPSKSWLKLALRTMPGAAVSVLRASLGKGIGS